MKNTTQCFFKLGHKPFISKGTPRPLMAAKLFHLMLWSRL